LRKPLLSFVFLGTALVACGAEPDKVSESAGTERQKDNVEPGQEGEITETVSAATGQEIAFDVPADSRAEYQLLSVVKNDEGLLVATTRRTGSSGSSYSVREIDCARQLFRYIGDGDTLDQAMTPLQNPGTMATLVAGSSSHAAVQIACSQLPG